MKRILITIILAGSFSLCFAQWRQYPQNGGGPNQYPDYPQQTVNYGGYSSLVISSVSQRQLSVLVDNYQYQGNNGNDKTLSIGNINAGSHQIVVYQWKTNFWGKRVRDVVYNSSLFLKQGFETTIFINAFGQVNIGERRIFNNGNYAHGDDGNCRPGKGRHKHKNKNHCDDNDDRRNNTWNQNGRGDRDDD